MRTCPVCGGRSDEPVLKVGGVPVFSNALWPTADAARAAVVAPVELVLCRDCGLIRNVAFDADLVAYSPAYENSLHFSEVFRRYAEELAQRLVTRYDLGGRRVVEVGSGSGAFLAQLCELAGATGVGYDPSFDPERAEPVTSDRIRIVAEPFPEDGVDADFVTCQHVLEHVADPMGLLRTIRRSTAGSGRDGAGATTYLEVPDATHMLRAPALWDVLYEHCSYFAAPTLRAAFERSGFRVLDSGRSFGDQYLWVEAVPGSGGRDGTVAAADVAELAALGAVFEQRFRSEVDRWNERLPELAADGPVALWGMGSKGVTFLNAVEAATAHVAVGVDVNPRKHGLHVPGTGHRVVAPEDLAAAGVRHVILLNPVYQAEVAAALDRLDLDATLEVP